MSDPAALKAYRDRLKAQGRLLEARAVDHCIVILRGSAQASKPTHQNGAGEAIGTPAATTPRTAGIGVV